ncbi:MAG: HlyC/CorC family transporter [Candidatus Cloacimonetes bacterium]|jgi:putative hemolysin|nr:HlyC/CorC family transporter [Candidatus Cloacimonadota bacterium]MBT6993650.1 HlyC/CorC family transporter [Candidatus Cloacimonadota bacterium]
MNFSYLIIVGFLFLSAVFSSSETAFFSLSKIQLKKIELDDSKNAKRILKLIRNPRELLIIILLGNTIVNVAASSTAALIAIEIGDKYFGDAETFALFFEIVIMTILLLIFGEITPKLIAFASPQKVANYASFFLLILKYCLYPVIKILELLSLLFSTRKSRFGLEKLTTEDFQNLIKSDVTKDYLEEDEKKIIKSVFRFSSTITKEVMVPRVDIKAINVTAGLDKIIEIINESGHSKIPIFKKNIDNIIGIIYAKDIILNLKKKSINSLLRPPIIVTENAKISKLLNQFKQQKIQIAIVVDEYGGTSGLITLEDVLEELVGEIRDEFDKEPALISQKNEFEYDVSGMFSIAELNDEFDLEIDAEYDNLADFLFDQFNKVPQKQESIIFKNKVKFTVSEVDGQRIQYAKMTLLNDEK